MNIQSPYINTYLYTTVGLHPSQFDNDIYKHLKNNLIRKIQGRCYKNYGYISKIYKIEERQGGEIIAEDPSASALYKVKISCKICKPLKGTIVVCEVKSINKALIYLQNGPINILIFENSGAINQDNFTFDDRKNVLIANLKDGQKIPVEPGTFVEIKVSDTRIEHNSNRILVIGTLENIASKKAVDESVKQRENDGLAFTIYDDYMDNEKTYHKTYINENDVSENEESETENEDMTESESDLN